MEKIIITALVFYFFALIMFLTSYVSEEVFYKFHPAAKSRLNKLDTKVEQLTKENKELKSKLSKFTYTQPATNHNVKLEFVENHKII